MISYKIGAAPYINKKHIDGPLPVCRDGQLHWLTLWERWLLFRGKIDAYSLEHKVKNYGRKSLL